MEALIHVHTHKGQRIEIRMIAILLVVNSKESKYE